MRLRSMLVVSVVAVAVLGTLPSALAMTHFQVTSEDSQPVPERPFDFEGETYRIDSVIQANTNDTVNVSVTAPSQAYRVNIYNSKEQIVDARRAEGDESLTFDLLRYEPGSYAVAVYLDGDYEAIEPLVVEAYNLTVDAPDRVAADENASVRLDIERTGADGSPHDVTVVLTGDENERLVNATGSDGEYTAPVEAGTLDSGNYTVYGLAQGEAQAFGRNEIVGLSDRVSLSVTEPTSTSTPEPTATPEQSSGPTPTATATQPAPTATATPAPPPMPTDTPETETEEPAITPNEAAQPTTTSGSGPGLTGFATVVGVALAVALLAHRKRT